MQKVARNKKSRPKFRGVHIIEVGKVWFLAFLGLNELFVIERCPYYRGVRNVNHYEILTLSFLQFDINSFHSKVFRLIEYALFILTLRMFLLESYKSVVTATFSKVWTFSSLRTRPMSSSGEIFDRFVFVTVHPPYFSINFTKGSFPRLFMAVILRQVL